VFENPGGATAPPPAADAYGPMPPAKWRDFFLEF